MPKSCNQSTNLYLTTSETINPSQVRLIRYSRPSDDYGRLGNQAAGFPFEAFGHQWKNSEFLYLCGRWSLQSQADIQSDICSATSGYAARRYKYQKYRKMMRSDFDEWKHHWMLLIVWMKCLGNKDFRDLLLSTGEDTCIAEVEKRDPYWAVTEGEDGLLRGVNAMGKILMTCRYCLLTGTQPDIDRQLLESKGICLFGERLHFTEKAQEN